MNYNLPPGWQMQIIPPNKGSTDYLLYITDHTFHYEVVYDYHPPEEHISIHIQRAILAFGDLSEKKDDI